MSSNENEGRSKNENDDESTNEDGDKDGPTKRATLFDLPIEIVRYTAHHLRAGGACRMALACQGLYDAIMTDSVTWKRLYAKTSGRDPEDPACVWLRENRTDMREDEFWRWFLRATVCPVPVVDGLEVGVGFRLHPNFPGPDGEGDRNVSGGDWDRGELEGWGYIRTWSNVYVGQIREGRPCGLGASFLDDGEVYKGRWMNGKRHGTGELSFSASSDGRPDEWLCGAEDGDRHGSVATIQFDWGRAASSSVMRWTSGATYVGALEHGTRSWGRVGFGVDLAPRGKKREAFLRCGVWEGLERCSDRSHLRGISLILNRDGSWVASPHNFREGCSSLEIRPMGVGGLLVTSPPSVHDPDESDYTLTVHGNGDVALSEESSSTGRVSVVLFVCSPRCPDPTFRELSFVGLSWDLHPGLGAFVPAREHRAERDAFLAYVRAGHIGWSAHTRDAFLLLYPAPEVEV